ncbi:MAG: GxxExxY protein [Patescibacteria group bacterium]
MHKSTQTTNKNFLEAELSYRIQGVIYGVSNKYGKGLKEQIYQKALEEEFEKNNIYFEKQKRINIYSLSSGKSLGVYVPDFLIEDKIILEIKASNFTTKQDVNQQLSYLRASAYEIGYLVNFGTSSLYVKRFIFTNDRKSFIPLIKNS